MTLAQYCLCQGELYYPGDETDGTDEGDDHDGGDDNDGHGDQQVMKRSKKKANDLNSSSLTCEKLENEVGFGGAGCTLGFHALASQLRMLVLW